MSEAVSSPESDQDPTAEVPPSDPAPLEENKAEQGTVAPVIVWRTLLLEQ
ncbi:hypothetical protein J3P85_11675 [Pseudomonas sp. Z1-12]